MKICRKCKRELEEGSFHKHKGYKDGLHPYCKDCRKKINHEYYLKNSDILKSNRILYYEKNKDLELKTIKLYIKKKSLEDPDFYKKRNKKYKKYHEKYFKEWEANQRANNPTYRIKKALQTRLHDAIKDGYKSARTKELLGCTFEEVKAHLESQFVEGMTWENYGKGGWEIDHIKPCASFDLSDPEQQKICFHYSNLQPLWWWDNLAKGYKLNWK